MEAWGRELLYRSTLFLISVLDGGGWSTPRPSRFKPMKETRYPLYRKLGGHQGPVWTGAEYLVTTGVRSPNRPARGESPNTVAIDINR
jgi:hypothetical protein